jgi:hypothetical protein
MLSPDHDPRAGEAIFCLFLSSIFAPVRRSADDPSGDRLDALFCAIQTAWAWTMRSERYGAPEHLDPLEGWIANPSLREIQEPAGPASA